jgi:hypothetical protein
VETGLAIGILLVTTVVSALVAGYYRLRYESVNRQLFRSDAIATGRAAKIQELQMRIESMKYRK